MNTMLTRMGLGILAAGLLALIGGVAYGAGAGRIDATFATPAGVITIAGLAFLLMGLAVALLGVAPRPGRPFVRTALFSIPAIALVVAAGASVAFAARAWRPVSTPLASTLANGTLSADALVAATKATAASYPTTDAARAAGYQPLATPNGQGAQNGQNGQGAQNGQATRNAVLFQSQANINDGALLDPARPEALVFLGSDGAAPLIGVIYLAPSGTGPTLDGALPAWKPVQSLLTNGNQQARPARGQDLDGLVVWTFDHPGGALAQSIDRNALQALVRALPAAPATPAAPAANTAPYRGTQTGTVTAIDNRSITIQTDQGSRTMAISARTSIAYWGETARPAQVADVTVGKRVSVSTPFRQQPDAAVNIVILS